MDTKSFRRTTPTSSPGISISTTPSPNPKAFAPLAVKCYPIILKVKIEEIQGYESLATKADIKALELSIRELRVDVKEQFQRIRILIWLPVITGAVQILLAILKH